MSSKTIVVALEPNVAKYVNNLSGIIGTTLEDGTRLIVHTDPVSGFRGNEQIKNYDLRVNYQHVDTMDKLSKLPADTDDTINVCRLSKDIQRAQFNATATKLGLDNFEKLNFFSDEAGHSLSGMGGDFVVKHRLGARGTEVYPFDSQSWTPEVATRFISDNPGGKYDYKGDEINIEPADPKWPTHHSHFTVEKMVVSDRKEYRLLYYKHLDEEGNPKVTLYSKERSLVGDGTFRKVLTPCGPYQGESDPNWLVNTMLPMVNSNLNMLNTHLGDIKKLILNTPWLTYGSLDVYVHSDGKVWGLFESSAQFAARSDDPSFLTHFNNQWLKDVLTGKGIL